MKGIVCVLLLALSSFSFSCASHHAMGISSDYDHETSIENLSEIEMMRMILTSQERIDILSDGLKIGFSAEEMGNAIEREQAKIVPIERLSEHRKGVRAYLRKELALKDAEYRALRRLLVSGGENGM